MTLIERRLDRELDLVSFARAQRTSDRATATVGRNGGHIEQASREHDRIEQDTGRVVSSDGADELRSAVQNRA
jgi:hypothetical protein